MQGDDYIRFMKKSVPTCSHCGRKAHYDESTGLCECPHCVIDEGEDDLLEET